MRALRSLGFGVLVLTASSALASPRSRAAQQSSTPMPAIEPLKITTIPDPPRSKAPTVAAIDPVLYHDTTEPKRQLVLEATLGTVAGACLVASVPLIQNAYSLSGGSLPKREAERDLGYALIAVGGVVAIADIAIAVVDARRTHRRDKAREASSSSSSSALTIRF